MAAVHGHGRAARRPPRLLRLRAGGERVARLDGHLAPVKLVQHRAQVRHQLAPHRLRQRQRWVLEHVLQPPERGVQLGVDGLAAAVHVVGRHLVDGQHQPAVHRAVQVDARLVAQRVDARDEDEDAAAQLQVLRLGQAAQQVVAGAQHAQLGRAVGGRLARQQLHQPRLHVRKAVLAVPDGAQLQHVLQQPAVPRHVNQAGHGRARAALGPCWQGDGL
mmetsp:Transcript_8407/g.20976  ORF Transcript_8407/g.20976 Transcript_8407/m.20976 type:complete len:218 (+) Transcript_8407:1104-1757(+)